MAACNAGGGNRAASEETALGFVQAIASDFGRARGDACVPTNARRRARQARAFVTTWPRADHGLEAVAARRGALAVSFPRPQADRTAAPRPWPAAAQSQ